MFGWSFVFYFYVVHDSYIIKEKHRKITGVTLLRKLALVPVAGFIVILMGFWFVLSFYMWVVGKEKGCYWLSNDIVGLVGNLAI